MSGTYGGSGGEGGRREDDQMRTTAIVDTPVWSEERKIIIMCIYKKKYKVNKEKQCIQINYLCYFLFLSFFFSSSSTKFK